MRRFQSILLASIVVVLFVGAIAARRTHAAPSPDTGCTSQSACLTETNSGKGEGIDGFSNKNNGVRGVTHFASTSNTSFKAGVTGLDLSSSGLYNAGVFGESTSGFGLMGSSLTGTGANGSSQGTGVSGFSTGGGTGVLGIASSGTGLGVEGSGGTAGVQALNTSSTSSSAFRALGSGGLLFNGVGSSNNSVFTVDDTGNLYAANTVYGNGGIAGFCTAPCPKKSVYYALIDTDQVDGYQAVAETPYTTLFTGYGDGGGLIGFQNKEGIGAFGVEDDGDVLIAGEIFTHGSCDTGCAPPNGPGKHVTSYVPRESQPTEEDFGEAQLVNGSAYVALDSTFASVIQRHMNYLVFITPEGDSRGLYVTQKSSAGFGVRENLGGRSTLTFDYRIVAKPYGDTSPKLPTIMLPRGTRPAPIIPKSIHDRTPRPKISIP
jgi:hypothetical protein